MSENIIAIFTAGLFLATLALCYFTAMMVRASKSPLPLVTIIPKGHGFNLEIENVGTGTAFDVTYETIPKKGVPVMGTPSEVPLPFEKISVLKPNQIYSSYIGNYGDWNDQNFHVLVKWFNDVRKLKQKSVQYSLSTHFTNSFPDKNFEKEIIKNSNKISIQATKIAEHLGKINNNMQKEVPKE